MKSIKTQAQAIKKILALCRLVDPGKLQQLIDQARRHETTGMLYQSPQHYRQSVARNKIAIEKTRALKNLVEIVQKYGGKNDGEPGKKSPGNDTKNGNQKGGPGNN